MQRDNRCETIFKMIFLLSFVSLVVNSVTAEYRFGDGNLLCVPLTSNPKGFPPGGDFIGSSSSGLDVASYKNEGSMEIIIGINSAFRGNYEKTRALIARDRGKIIDTILMESKPKALVADVPHESLSSLKWKLLTEGLARYVEPNIRLRLAGVPNDPEWYRQWGLSKIKADFAWNTTVGKSSVIIAIVDTGVDWKHPDLAANIWNNTDEWIDGKDNDQNGFIDDIRGWDFVDTITPVWPGEDGTVRDNDPMDFQGHGSHCAGIAAAVGNNGIGVSGVTWDCKIMPVRAGYKGADGRGYLEAADAAAAIIYAAENHANIISCSWGLYDNIQIIHEAVEYAYNAGVLLVAAAGNELTDENFYPAAYNEVMAISATNDQDRAALFSNFGEWIELAAPGTDIYSTILDDSYDYMSGTSMATPFVAGVAALVWSRFPNMNRNQVRGQLRFTSDDLGEEGFDVRFGYGRLNARRAVELEQKSHDLMIFETSTTSVIPLGEPVQVNATVLNMGTLDEHNLNVQFLVNSSLIKSEKLTFLASGELKTLSFLWNTSRFVEGYYNLAVYAIPVSGEIFTENNFLSRRILLRPHKILRVPQDFETIQEAVNKAFEGDTLMVASGTYYENVYIRKDFLKFIGEDVSTTIVDGGGRGNVFLIWADHTEIRGFTLRNSGKNPTEDVPFSGALVYDCESVNLTDVVATNNWAGIFLYCSSNVGLKGNHMTGNHFNFGIEGYRLSDFIHSIDESNMVENKPICYIKNGSHRTVSTAGGCVLLVNSTNIRVEKLELVNNYAGILCLASANISIINLKVSLNQIGVYVRNCVSVTVRSSNLTKNRVGILVEDAEKVTVKKNVINNAYSFGDGIRIIDSNGCETKFNLLTDNAQGLYLSYSNNNTVSFNILRRNYINLWLYYSNENIVRNNEASSSLFSGIFLTSAHNNLLIENHLLNNIFNVLGEGIALNIETSFNNSIFHNKFIDNTYNVFTINSVNKFDDGYLSGGNYWSDYTFTDYYSGPYQNETGSDGIGDAVYIIDEHNVDRYPLMNPWVPTSRFITATVEIYPQILNLRFRGGWITAYIELPEGYDVYDIDVSTIMLNETISAGLEFVAVADYDNDIIQDLMVNLNRTLVAEYILSNGIMTGNVRLTVTGNLLDGTLFEGSNVIKVRMAGDINIDGKVDIKDLCFAAKAFGSYPGHARWNYVADENEDSKIDILDIALIAKNFGKTYP